MSQEVAYSENKVGDDRGLHVDAGVRPLSPGSDFWRCMYNQS